MSLNSVLSDMTIEEAKRVAERLQSTAGKPDSHIVIFFPEKYGLESFEIGGNIVPVKGQKIFIRSYGPNRDQNRNYEGIGRCWIVTDVSFSMDVPVNYKEYLLRDPSSRIEVTVKPRFGMWEFCEKIGWHKLMRKIGYYKLRYWIKEKIHG